MNGKKILGLFAGIALAFAGVAVAADNGPETIVLKGPKGKKPPVTFKHKAHQEKMKCGECHHGKGPDGKQIPYVEGQKIQKCADCHKLGKANDVIHKNCKGCHKQKKEGPVKCNDCHKKK